MGFQQLKKLSVEKWHNSDMLDMIVWIGIECALDNNQKSFS